jgi:hypothetical protein
MELVYVRSLQFDAPNVDSLDFGMIASPRPSRVGGVD